MIDPTNPQSYAESALADSSIADEVRSSPDALFNHRDPNLVVQHEKFEHRIMIMLKASGFSNREIAQKTGYTDAFVSQILRQPWAQRRIAQEIREAGRDEVQGMLAASAVDSVATLIELRDDHTTEGSVRRAAADSLLDRFLGKPTQRVESRNETRITATDVEQLDTQIAELEAEEKRLRGNAPKGVNQN